MSLNTNPMYSLRDVAIIPAETSIIESRSQCNPYYIENNTLPIFASPMSAVVNLENVHIWENNKITPIIPRNIDFEIRKEYAINGYWVAVSLNEFKELCKQDIFFKQCKQSNQTIKILVDIANGHMSVIYQYAREFKTKAVDNEFKTLLMVGNIANPSTTKFIYELNKEWSFGNLETKKHNPRLIDYIRVGIGSGRCCSSSSSTSIHYGMASLLNDINNYKFAYTGTCYWPYIIADGGIKTYNDAITALALGADYVMIGTTFASLFESAAKFIKEPRACNNIIFTDNEDAEKEKRNYLHNMRSPLKKYVYGMSTYVAQKEIKSNASDTKRLTEGIGRYVECNMTIKEWTEGFIGFLSSCMSYCGKQNISDFIGNVECRVMSPTLNSVINNSIDSKIYNDIHIIDETK